MHPPRSMMTIMPFNCSALFKSVQAREGLASMTFPEILSSPRNSGPKCAGPARRVTSCFEIGFVNVTVCGFVSELCECILLSSTISCMNKMPSSASSGVFAWNENSRCTLYSRSKKNETNEILLCEYFKCAFD